jgi:hypothetical protein
MEQGVTLPYSEEKQTGVPECLGEQEVFRYKGASGDYGLCSGQWLAQLCPLLSHKQDNEERPTSPHHLSSLEPALQAETL